MSRKYETEIEIAGTAEAVWKAIAEADGIRSWFAPDARVTPGVGGEIWVSWGPGMEGASQIEIWEPNRHQRFGHPQSSGEPKMVDFTIEARDGGTTTLRLVNSGFGDDAKFDDEVESTSRAWLLFLFLLKYSVEHPHKKLTNVTKMPMPSISREEAWEKLRNGLSVDGTVLREDPPANICYQLANANQSLLAIFCEKCGGSTAVTIMAVGYDLEPEQEERVRQLTESIAAKFS